MGSCSKSQWYVEKKTIVDKSSLLQIVVSEVKTIGYREK